MGQVLLEGLDLFLRVFLVFANVFVDCDAISAEGQGVLCLEYCHHSFGTFLGTLQGSYFAEVCLDCFGIVDTDVFCLCCSKAFEDGKA